MAYNKMMRVLERKLDLIARSLGIDTESGEWTGHPSPTDSHMSPGTDLPKVEQKGEPKEGMPQADPKVKADPKADPTKGSK